MKPLKPLRTRFAKDIVAEFLPPSRPSRNVIIFLSGMPSMPKLSDTLRFYAQKGFWVIHPRYRGSWESSGSFLQVSPEEDVLDVMDQLSKGFSDAASGKKYSIKNPIIYLFGSSFGGPAALLSSRDKRVAKVVTVSPVIDWTSESKKEPLGPMFAYVKNAFGEGYRLTQKNWKKLQGGAFYNPIRQAENLDGKKMLIFQAKDDEVVSYKPAERFAEITRAKLMLIKKGGHFGSAYFSDPVFYKQIKRFLDAK